jgi:hypothetical protein
MFATKNVNPILSKLHCAIVAIHINLVVLMKKLIYRVVKMITIIRGKMPLIDEELLSLYK